MKHTVLEVLFPRHVNIDKGQTFYDSSNRVEFARTMLDHHAIIFFFFLSGCRWNGKIHFYAVENVGRKRLARIIMQGRDERDFSPFPLFSFPNVFFRRLDVFDRLKFEDSIDLLRALKEAFSRRETIDGGKEEESCGVGGEGKEQSEISFVSSMIACRGKKDIELTTRRRFRTGFYYDFT